MKQIRKSLLSVCAALLAIGLTALAGGCSGKSASEETASVGSVSDYGAEIEAFVEEHLRTTAGLAVSVYDANHILYQGNFGYANREKETAVDAETVFEWGSVSKLLVWVSVMQQVEKGRIDLKSDIREYLPSGFLTNVKDGQLITMEHLMNHTAGFQEKIADLYVDPGETIPDLAGALKSHMPAQVFDAGEVTAYSNWGTALAAYIVERVSKMSYAEYVRTNIFRPLGMLHTAILPDYSDSTFVMEKRPETLSYTVHNEKIKKDQFAVPLYPAGMCAGTLEDFALFAQALLPGITSRALFTDPSTLSSFYLPTDLYTDGRPKNSHGLWNLYFGIRLLGHGGNSVGQTATLLFDPEGEIGICIMTNQAQETTYNRELVERLFGSFQGSAYDTGEKLPSGRFRSARGIYRGALLFSQKRPAKLKKSDLTSHYFVTSRTADGRTRLEQPYYDYLSSPLSDWMGELLRLLWFALAVVGTAGYLVRGMLYQLRSRQRRVRERPEMVWYLILLEGLGDVLVILQAVHMIRITRLLKRFAASRKYSLLLLFNGVNWVALIALSLITLAMFFLAKRRGDSNERIPAFALREVLWLGAIVCCGYWQMFPFWVW